MFLKADNVDIPLHDALSMRSEAGAIARFHNELLKRVREGERFMDKSRVIFGDLIDDVTNGLFIVHFSEITAKDFLHSCAALVAVSTGSVTGKRSKIIGLTFVASLPFDGPPWGVGIMAG